VVNAWRECQRLPSATILTAGGQASTHEGSRVRVHQKTAAILLRACPIALRIEQHIPEPA
jgi:hypothetical protein